jgi:hypothetical protein
MATRDRTDGQSWVLAWIRVKYLLLPAMAFGARDDNPLALAWRLDGTQRLRGLFGRGFHIALQSVA